MGNIAEEKAISLTTIGCEGVHKDAGNSIGQLLSDQRKTGTHPGLRTNGLWDYCVLHAHDVVAGVDGEDGAGDGGGEVAADS